ncbi:MAG: hypothetical protein KAR42_08835 [candidate division Zixibacteria bacterium]|nr:hypothetical protein [candidate division Zixibacteria bacterium]
MAEAVWLPIYGNSIYKTKPFVAKLKDDTTWFVQGTIPEGILGGVPEITIHKMTGQILHVIHSK